MAIDTLGGAEGELLRSLRIVLSSRSSTTFARQELFRLHLPLLYFVLSEFILFCVILFCFMSFFTIVLIPFRVTLTSPVTGYGKSHFYSIVS